MQCWYIVFDLPLYSVWVFFSFKISTERLLLADQNKWEKAIKMIMNTFDDAAKWTKNASHKNGQYTCTILN